MGFGISAYLTMLEVYVALQSSPCTLRRGKSLVASNGHEGYGFLELLAVNPDSQGLGIGGMLFACVENYLRGKGASALYLVTDDGCD